MDKKKIAVIGIGLIGSSILRALRAYAEPEYHTIAYDKEDDVRAKARALMIADDVFDDVIEAVKDADIIIIATPMGVMPAVVKTIALHVKMGAIISDVGSVKAPVLKAFQAYLPQGVHGIPAHPVAGTEHSGVEAGFATLFQKRWCILTPAETADEVPLRSVQVMWEKMGAKVEVMSAERHDRVLAVTSHIPHLIAYTIVGTASDLEHITQSEVIKYSAGGFRDFTRIAASDPTMWRDIFLTNKEAVLEMLQQFTEDLTALQRAIRWEDGDQLYDLFARTRAIRRSILEHEK